MTYNLAQLVATQTSDQRLTELLATLTGKGYAATTWQTGGLQRTLIELFAIALARQSDVLAEITKGGYLDEAENEWLTALASEVYQITRAPSVSAVYSVTLTETAGSPQSISTGALWVGTPDGKRYQSLASGDGSPQVVPANSQLDILVQAESPGAAYNTGAGNIIIMHTPITGVTVNNAYANPEIAGADAEGDPSVRQRCKDKWSALGAGGNEAAYRAWATEASTSVKKVKIVTNPGGVAGLVGIYLAGETSGVSGAVVAAVQAYVRLKCPTCATPLAASATTQAVPITGNAYVWTEYAAAFPAAANAALDEVFKAVPIGAQVDYSDIVAALANVPGVDRIDLSAPLTNTLPSANTVMLVKGTVTLPVTAQ